ncbi:PAS domain S-box protein [Methylobacterium oryzihabitans]|uniref:Blue-light-activated histidine kinase n=2 Tax=Methylobacterium oryzihabitans TaxID=2499852 RepID=A0A3S2W6T3_9HYPH|nr:PAS domain S-box protein [Methylobacterium oryzihabitans]
MEADEVPSRGATRQEPDPSMTQQREQDEDRDAAAASAALLADPEAIRWLVETIPQLLWRSHALGEWIWASRQWTAFTGQSDAAARGQGWLAVVHPDDRARTREAWRAAESRGGLEVEHRLRQGGDGGYRWFETRAAPRRDAAGRILEWFGTATDVHDLKLSQQRQAELLAELQHRVRNTLSAVRAIARRSAETSTGKDDYAMHLDGRLAAISRVQSAVIRNPAGGLDLAMLVADELLVCGVREGEAARIAGPPVLLHARAAEILGLALHELATNAVKFGALSALAGRVAATWVIEPAEPAVLTFDWVERGGPPVPGPPARRGFGLEVLEERLAHDLDARTILDFARKGLSCRIVLPLTARVVRPG